MIHPEDSQLVQQMTGFDAVPEDVAAECGVRLAMYHRGGGTGPLGTLAVVDVLRSLGYKAEQERDAPAAVDWSAYPGNGSVRVEARFFGTWMPGRFHGFVEHGMLNVRLDNDDVHRECMPCIVRLAATSEAAGGADGRVDGQPDTVSSPDEPAAEAIEIPPAEPVGIASVADDDPEPPDDGVDASLVEALSAVPTGTKVWVEINDDYKDGVLHEVDGSGMVIVQIDGEDEQRIVRADSVRVLS